MQFIGIDIGTTSICAVVLSLEKNKIEYTLKINNSARIESKNDWEKIQDVNTIVKNARDLLDRILMQIINSKDTRIGGVAVTGQMHGILYLDKTGNVLSPLYTWQDNRSRLIAGDKITYIDDLKNKTGTEIFPGYGLATHYYNLKNNLIPKSTRYISTIADYVSMILSGRKIPVIDYNNAASWGFFNLDKLQFEYSLLDKVNIDGSHIPEVVKSGTVIGELKNKCPVVCATGDNQASILGSTKNLKEMININVGTGGQVNVFSDQNIKIEGIEPRPYFGSGYILLGASLCGGAAIALLEKFFKNTEFFLTDGKSINIYEKIDKIDSIIDCKDDRLKIDTRFDGTRSNPSLRGSIKNISVSNFTPENLIAGLQEGIVRELYGYYKLIKRTLKIRPKQLTGAGNGIRKNKLIRLFLEDIFEMPVRLTEYPEEAAAGAALTAAVGTGFISSFLDAGEIITYN